MSDHSYRPYLWMIAGCLSFSIMSVLAHEAGQRCNWQTVAFFRSFLVMLFVGFYALRTGTRLVLWRPGRLWLRSLSGSFSLVTGFYALQKLSASTVATLANTFPVWVAILSWPMLGKFPSARIWPAVLGGVAGVYLIQQPQAGQNDFAFVVALLSAFSTAIAMIGLHRLKHVNPNAVVVHFSLVATFCCAGAFFLFDRDVDAVPFYDPTAAVLLIGVGMTASLGQMLLTRAFASGEPAKVSVLGLSQVLFTLTLDVLLVGRSLSGMIIFGTLMIVIPTAWVMMERPAVVEREEPPG